MKIGMLNKPRPSSGLVLYDGESELDGGPVFVVATFGTSNVKTGDLIQTWIMRSDMHPMEAAYSGADESICGVCPHRSVNGGKRSCYVNLAFGPRSVWDAYQAGKYRLFCREKHLHLFQGQLLRVGAYGDPVAVPVEVWQPLVHAAYRTAAYTHLWRMSCAAPFRSWTMASVDSLHEREEAHLRGWRTYRTDGSGKLGANEVWCPATEPGGNRALCETCMACDGLQRGDKRVDIATPVHGSGVNHFFQWSEVREQERQGIYQTELFADERHRNQTDI